MWTSQMAGRLCAALPFHGRRCDLWFGGTMEHRVQKWRIYRHQRNSFLRSRRQGSLLWRCPPLSLMFNKHLEVLHRRAKKTRVSRYFCSVFFVLVFQCWHICFRKLLVVWGVDAHGYLEFKCSGQRMLDWLFIISRALVCLDIIIVCMLYVN